MKQRLQPVKRLLGNAPALSDLLAQLQSQHHLLQRVRDALPSELQDHCRAALLKERTLLIYADSSAWASRLRYLSRELAGRLSTAQLPVGRVSIRVMLTRGKAKQSLQRAPREISERNKRLLEQTAEGISDPELREVLLRLGRHRHSSPSG